MNTRIKVTHCIGSLGVGGAESQLTELINRLPADRFEQRLVLFRREGELLGRIAGSGCEVIGLWPPVRDKSIRFRYSSDTPKALVNFVRHLRGTRPHVLHAQLTGANNLASRAGRVAGVPSIATSQLNLCPDIPGNTRLQRTENRTHQRADGVLANSQAIVDDLIDHQGVDPARIRHIYNGVDPDRFVPRSHADQRAQRLAFGVGADQRVIACVANLHAYKGHADLIRAFAHLDPVVNNLLLMLIGRDAGVEPELRRLAGEFGIAAAVRFVGQIVSVEDVLCFAEFIVHPSHEEGFSNAIIEAMSAGKAVVSTAVGGSCEAIVNGHTGLLVPPRRPEALAASINELLVDVDRTVEMGRAGRARATVHYGMDRMIAEFGQWYQDLASRTDASDSSDRSSNGQS